MDVQTPVLKRVERLDSIPLGDTYWTDEGYLVDKPIVTSVGIFEYANKDGSIRRELRLPEHVFAKESLASYRGKPVILTHRAGTVDKDNVDREHIGTILSDGIQDGDDVRAEIIIHDTDVIQKSGLRELSLGYSLDLDETPGTWNGQHYDAVQTNIRINHLALVNKARAGEQARLNIDSRDEISEGGAPMDKNKDNLTPEELEEAIKQFKAKRAAHADGGDEDKKPEAIPAKEAGGSPDCAKKDGDSSEENTDGDDPVKMIKDRRDRRKDNEPEDGKASIKQMDEDIGTLLKIIEQMKAKADCASAPTAVKKDEDESKPKEPEKPMNADSVDAVVRERVGLLRVCDKLHLDSVDDLTIPQLKRAVIKAVKPTLRLDGQSDDYIDAAYDIALGEVNARKDTNYQRRQMFHADAAPAPREPSGASARRQQMINDMDGGNEE